VCQIGRLATAAETAMQRSAGLAQPRGNQSSPDKIGVKLPDAARWLALAWYALQRLRDY
jgi:hypothetical protein